MTPQAATHSLVLLRMSEFIARKYVELIGIINKPLLLHLVGCLYFCVVSNDKMVTQSLNLLKISVINFLPYIPVIHKLSYSTRNDIFHWNISPFQPYISLNDVLFRFYLISPNSLVVSHKLKIFATTPGQVLHSVVKERVSTPTNSTIFNLSTFSGLCCCINAEFYIIP